MSIEYSSKPVYRSGIVTAAGNLMPNFNGSRRTMIVQNLGTNPLYVKFGDSASTTDFDVILKGGASNDDGAGGVFLEDTLSYQGIVSIAGTSPRCVGTAF